MRNLSDMKANELTKCICEIAGPAEKIFCDCAVTEAIDAYQKKIKEDIPIQQGFAMFVRDVFPVLMDKHQDDVYDIFASMDGVAVDEVKNRPGVQFMREVFESFVLDGDLPGIFRPVG